MSDLKNMYKTILGDPFPADMTVRLGDRELVYRKRTWTLEGEEKGLRYGENPDQPAALYELAEGSLTLGGVTFRGAGKGLVSALTEEHMIQAGKHPGKTNLTDVDNGINMLQYLTAKPAALILKHNNPCGAAWSDKGIADALDKAFRSDRIAAFGGAVVVNRPMDKAAAELVNSAYFEVVAAPDFEEGVVDILKKRKNLRILHIPGMARLEELVNEPFLDFKCLADGGIIIQQSFRNRILSVDDFIPATAEKNGVQVAARKPTAQEAEDLLFAWAVESGVTSNSIIFARSGATVSIGTGEQDRVGCVELTVHKAYTKFADMLAFNEQNMSLYELKLKAQKDPALAEVLSDIEARTRAEKGGLMGTSMVSDGFFPFRDGVDAALAHGVAAIAQPGGSVRDHEVIQAVNEASPQVAMVFTGQRSFKH
ncbi:IMP cyclohydrolase [Desulfovibrio subterraneus]|jgi:phosphoribosylaminoimidazolecarboxamide formyltransferase/IMP cyclohydrolase|uniref:Phosphoribosylaminoimidazolecarboxamide formyltransferase n=1 Tax=Desulfovibrio subterraneus TaxID=2718620 RepID=A0A7J0BD96_9BACT|nr:IMP cyclohydrolase [Desulfovibrio subterraneus]WBF66697.1 IMP cyclohydrolase [Desulfovibrio subterraneus]GFM31663.1 phosphoribosylaminoimidazolecarboxamide formyltransferase [Desulfovibrio subterraneus]